MFIYFIINFSLLFFACPHLLLNSCLLTGKKQREEERKYLVSTEILARSTKHDSTMDPIMAKLD